MMERQSAAARAHAADVARRKEREQQDFRRLQKVSFAPFQEKLCVMCGEPLHRIDTRPYHTPWVWGAAGLFKSDLDCTPSCMWCGVTFDSKAEMEAHETECEE